MEERNSCPTEGSVVPPAPTGADVTLKDEVYTRVGENLPPAESGRVDLDWIERESLLGRGAGSGKKSRPLV